MTEASQVKEAPRISDKESFANSTPTSKSDELAEQIFNAAVKMIQDADKDVEEAGIATIQVGEHFFIEIPGIFMDVHVRQLARSLRVLSDRNDHPEVHFHLVVEAWTVEFVRR